MLSPPLALDIFFYFFFICIGEWLQIQSATSLSFIVLGSCTRLSSKKSEARRRNARSKFPPSISLENCWKMTQSVSYKLPFVIFMDSPAEFSLIFY